MAGTAASCADEGAGRHHRIVIADVAFLPDSLAVATGDTITWSNHDLVWHTVSPSDGPAPWESGAMEEGATFTAVPRTTGTIRYTCRYHPTMNGVLVVR